MTMTWNEMQYTLNTVGRSRLLMLMATLRCMVKHNKIYNVIKPRHSRSSHEACRVPLQSGPKIELEWSSNQGRFITSRLQATTITLLFMS